MAKQKQETLVRELPSGIEVWTDEPEKELENIKRIEGVSDILFLNSSRIYVYTDPRYDKADVADEIKELLASDVPDVFRAGNV